MNTRKLLVLVLMLVSVLFSACAPAVTQTVPTAVPATAIAPAMTPTVAPAQTGMIFKSSTFKLPMTLSYESDWSITEYTNQVYLQKLSKDSWQLAFNLVDGATIADPNSAAEIPWPQDLVGYLKSNPYIEAGEPKPVMVGGFKGIQIDAHAKYTGDKRPFITIAGSAEGWLYLDYEEVWRFIVLDDVNGERLVITMTASPAPYKSPTTPVTEFSMFADAAQKVLDKVVFSNSTTDQLGTTFSPKTFNLITSVNFGSDWHVEEDYLHDLYLDNGQMPIVFNIVTTAQLVDPVGGNLMPFPGDFMSWIQSNPDFKTSKPTQVTIGGISGVQIDATPNTKINKKEFGLTWNILTSDGDWRFILLDNVNGEHVLIFMIAPAGKTFSELPELQQEIQQILDSVVFA